MRGANIFPFIWIIIIHTTQSYNVGYLSRSVAVQLRTSKKHIQVPLSVWSPSTSLSNFDGGYSYTIDIRSICRLLIGLSLPSFDFLRKTTIIPTPNLVQECLPSDLPPPPVVVFNHGYLGSRLDLHPLLHSLASTGMICVACDYPESLSGPYDTSWSKEDALTRVDILDAVLADVQSSYPTSGRIGLLGHSLGSGLASSFDTKDPLSPRCCIAGFRAVGETAKSSPFLVIASEGDSVCPSTFVMERVADVRKNNVKVGGGEVEGLFLEKYNHIDFLSAETNDAMVDFLSPLLPVARTLKVPLLDFDKYAENPNSKECFEAIESKVLNFFTTNLLER